MKKIVFPELFLKLNINKVAFEIFGVQIHWYGIFIAIAIVTAMYFCKKDTGKYSIKFDDILTLFLFIFPISIIGARLYYILFNLKYYLNNPMQIFDFRSGGLAIYGGIIAGALTIFIYSKIKRYNFLDILDYVVPYLAIGQAIGRWGNFFNQEAYGMQTKSFFRMGIIENGSYIEVHPTFLYESICNFVIFLILYYIRNKRRYKGQITYIYLTLYSFIRAIIEELRTDSLMLGNFKISQVLSIIIFIIFGSTLIYKKFEILNKKNKEI